MTDRRTPARPDVGPIDDPRDHEGFLPPDAGRVAHFWSWFAAGAVIVAILSATLLLLIGGPGQRELSPGEPVAFIAVLALGAWIAFRGVRWRSLLVVYSGLVIAALAILGLLGLPTCQGGCEGSGG